MKSRQNLFSIAAGLALGLTVTQPALAGGDCCAVGTHKGHTGAANPATTAAAPATPKPASAVLTGVLEHYAKIHAALAADSLGGVPAAARAIAQAVNDDATKSLPGQIAKQADELANAKTLEAGRASFKLLSQSLSRHLAAEKIQTGKHVQAYCSMAKAGWIQTDKAIRNPYYGSSMLTCGEVISTY